jgi:hypothetical protein
MTLYCAIYEVYDDAIQAEGEVVVVAVVVGAAK